MLVLRVDRASVRSGTIRRSGRVTKAAPVDSGFPSPPAGAAAATRPDLVAGKTPAVWAEAWAQARDLALAAASAKALWATGRSRQDLPRVELSGSRKAALSVATPKTSARGSTASPAAGVRA